MVCLIACTFAEEVSKAQNNVLLLNCLDTCSCLPEDFPYKITRLKAEHLIKKSKEKLEEGGLIYIATDEVGAHIHAPLCLVFVSSKINCFVSQQRDKSFFEPFSKHYDVVFLDDFKDQIKGINTCFYGMLDQLIASKGRVFFGTFFSTLSGYVNRMRGYYSAKHKLEGHKEGVLVRYFSLMNTFNSIMTNFDCAFNRNRIIFIR